MKHLIPCLLAAACLLPAAARAATDDTAAAKKICDQYKEAVIWISGVAKISISSGDSRNPMNIPDREQKFEAVGTIIDPSGMVVTALSNIDPAKIANGREVNTPQGKVTIEASSILKEVKIIMADGTEIPADVVMKDADLDLAFLRPKANAKEAKGVTYTAISLKDAGTADLADQVISLSRADEVLNRQPQVSRGQIITVTKKPRQFLRINNATQGAPSFTMDGKLLGIAVNRATKQSNPVTVVLPAADVLEIADQAKTAKPIVQEEKPKAADDDKQVKEDAK